MKQKYRRNECSQETQIEKPKRKIKLLKGNGLKYLIIGGMAAAFIPFNVMQHTKLTELTQQYSDLRNLNDDLRDDYNKLVELIEDANDNNKYLQNQVDELISDNKMLSNDLEAAQKTILDLTEKIIAQEQQLSELEIIAGSLTPTFNPYDITELSNLSYDELCIITKGTRWVGYEDKLLELESKYGVNVIFAISNSIMECGYTEMTGYAKRNNFFGINNATFRSVESCLEYYFRIIREFYIDTLDLKTIESIQPVYCPPNDTWDDGIISIGNKLLSRLEITSE